MSFESNPFGRSCWSFRKTCRIGATRAAGGVRKTAVILLYALSAQISMAQQPRVGDLGDFSLEQLAEVQLTSAASKRAQRADEAPSVITVVTADEIKRHGYRTLGDVLRTLPSFYVSYDRNYSYVGVRGFGRPGDYNTRVLLLIDGARTNDNIYDSAYVAREFPLDVDLIERVEVSRGPGSSAYGTNAVFAVVNVVTKRGRDLGGFELSAQAASFETYEARASYGRKFANGSEILASASLLDSRGQRLFFPEFAGEAEGGFVSGGDREKARRAFASYAKGGFRLDVAHARRDKGIPTASFGTLFGDTRSRTKDTWSLSSASYERSFGASFDWHTRLSLGAYDYKGTYAYAGQANDSSLYRDTASGRWWNAETSGVWRKGRHTVLAGGEFQSDFRQDQTGAYEGQLADLDSKVGRSRVGLFAQDDVELAKRLRLSLGARYDHSYANANDGSVSGRVSPRVALIAKPADRTTLKLLYGSAFRLPNEYELHYYATQADGLRPETIRTFEAAVEHSLGPNLRAAASIFSNRIQDLITLDSSDAGMLSFRNAGRIHSRGAEIALDARFSRGVVGRLSYSFQKTRDDAQQPLSNSPTSMLKANASVPLWKERAWASFDAQYLGSRRTLAGGRTDGFVLVNATLMTKRLKGGLEASLGVYNVFDTAYADPGSEEHVQDAIRQDGRSFAVKLGWRF